MAKKEKISEERKKLIQEFIKDNEIKNVTDIPIIDYRKGS